MEDTNKILLDDTALINAKTLNKSFDLLVQNDCQNAINGKKMPGLWEQRWYNERDDTSLYYNAGDAVWINAESIDDIVRKREADLYAYSAGNALLRKQLDEFKQNDDMAGYYARLKEFALGQVDKRKGPIFWLGDLTANAQVKISKKDNNTAFPDDKNSWEDFIWNSSIEEVQQSIMNFNEELIAAALSSHADDCHLQNSKLSRQDLYDSCLLKDFSNLPLSEIQKFRSHYWHESLHGFDHVKTYQHKKTTNGLVKWFRLWDSGYLEHGGIIDISNPFEKDAFDSSSNTCTVQLNWTYGISKTCPTYDYPSEGIIQFYGGDEQKYKSAQEEFDIPESYLGKKYRYDVIVTPICENALPYSSIDDGIYDNASICFMNNDRFSFIVPNLNCKKFSYSVRGYTMKGVNK